MALHRGIQSAIFYYLSCAPCTELSNRKKRRKEADRDRAQKHQLEMEQPGLYRHPSPFATNPHWQAEIDLGPTPLTTRRKKENKKKAAKPRPSAGGESNVTSNTSLPLVKGESNDSTWNLRRYQREDEDLWGSDLALRTSRASGLEGSLTNGKSTIISRPPTAKTARSDKTATSYYSANNPPINDMHPAIVTRMDDRNAAAWMMLPPPTARVMSGRDRPNGRVRSDSASSRVSSRMGNHSPLSRQMSHRIIDEKLRSGELLPAISLSRESSTRDSQRPTGLRHDRDTPPMSSTEYLSSEDATRSRRKQKPPPINVSEDSYDSDKTVIHRTPMEDKVGSDTLHPRRALSPIGSENARSRRSLRDSSTSRSRERSTGTESLENRHLSGRPVLTDVTRPDSSLNMLQELVPSSLLEVRKPTKQPSFEARIELPPFDSTEEMELLGSGKAAFKSWYEARDYDQFPEWVSERTRRDVTSRWSVDF